MSCDVCGTRQILYRIVSSRILSSPALTIVFSYRSSFLRLLRLLSYDRIDALVDQASRLHRVGEFVYGLEFVLCHSGDQIVHAQVHVAIVGTGSPRRKGIGQEQSKQCCVVVRGSSGRVVSAHVRYVRYVDATGAAAGACAADACAGACAAAADTDSAARNIRFVHRDQVCNGRFGLLRQRFELCIIIRP